MVVAGNVFRVTKFLRIDCVSLEEFATPRGVAPLAKRDVFRVWAPGFSKALNFTNRFIYFTIAKTEQYVFYRFWAYNTSPTQNVRNNIYLPTRTES